MNIDVVRKNHERFTFNMVHMTPESETREVVFIFPGDGYSYFGPLLYYPTQWMLEKNKAVIIADYDFRFFKEGPGFNREDALSFCLTECLEFAKEKYPNGKFSFCGKSIGTQAFCLLPDIANKINFDLSSSRFAWLTPVWKREDCLQSMIDFKYRSQYIIGDNDSHYSVASHERVKNNSLASIVVIKNADHSMDNDLSVEATFKIHREVFDNLFKFLL